MQQQTVDAIAEAQARREGFYGAPADRPRRNHNPGNIRACAGVTWQGQTGADPDFCVFADDAHGWRALKLNIAHHAANYPQQTLLEYIAGDGKGWPGYAPASDGNDPQSYAEAIAQALGVAVDTRFCDLP